MLQPKLDVDVQENVRDYMVVQQNIKKLTVDAKRGGATWMSMPCGVGQPKVKALGTLMSRGLDQLAVTQHLLPDEDCAKTILPLDVCVVDETNSHNVRVTSTHFASIEGRVYLQGDAEDVIVGLRLMKNEAATRKEMRRTLSLFTFDAIQQVVVDVASFILRPTKDAVLMLASGCLIVSASRRSVYVRWCISGDKDDTRGVTATLETLINKFQEIRQESSGYLPLFDHLRCV